MTLDESVARAEQLYLEEDKDVITKEYIEEAKLECEER